MFCDLIARFLFFQCNLSRNRTILIARNDMRIGNRKSATNSKIRIQKKSTFYTSRTSRRCSESLILRYIIVAQRNVYAKIQPQERRFIVYGKDFILREMSDTIILKQEIGNIIAKLDWKDSDACTRQDITQPMLVVRHTHQARTWCYGIRSYPNPWTQMSIFLG